MKQISSFVLRFSLCFLFLWFGVQQLIDPSAWIDYLPEWTGYFPVPSEILVGANGWFEIVFSILLLTGFWARFSAALLGLHLLGIAITAGGAIGIRDLALAGACFSIVFNTPEQWTLDHWFEKKKNDLED